MKSLPRYGHNARTRIARMLQRQVPHHATFAKCGPTNYGYEAKFVCENNRLAFAKVNAATTAANHGALISVCSKMPEKLDTNTSNAAEADDKANATVLISLPASQ